MSIAYFQIDIIWGENSEAIKELYANGEKDLLKPWYMALSDIYGMKTNNFDGYVHRAIITEPNTIRLVCYLLDDPKTWGLKGSCSAIQWKTVQAEKIEAALKSHIQQIEPNASHKMMPKLIVRPL